MTSFKHSPERDEEVFKLAEELAKSFTLVAELLAIARKWRSKAEMRAARIEQLESEKELLHEQLFGPRPESYMSTNDD